MFQNNSGDPKRNKDILFFNLLTAKRLGGTEGEPPRIFREERAGRRPKGSLQSNHLDDFESAFDGLCHLGIPIEFRIFQMVVTGYDYNFGSDMQGSSFDFC